MTKCQLAPSGCHGIDHDKFCPGDYHGPSAVLALLLQTPTPPCLHPVYLNKLVGSSPHLITLALLSTMYIPKHSVTVCLLAALASVTLVWGGPRSLPTRYHRPIRCCAYQWLRRLPQGDKVLPSLQVRAFGLRCKYVEVENKFYVWWCPTSTNLLELQCWRK
jgi:hypothetical protein